MPSSSDILIIQCGDTPLTIEQQHGKVPDWFKHALENKPYRIEVVKPFEGEALPDRDSFKLAIINGSSAKVTQEKNWIELTKEWVKVMMTYKKPLFGICFGHQLIADALGGRIGQESEGLELGLHEVGLHQDKHNDPLLNHLNAPFNSILFHEQTVLSLPKDAIALGYSKKDKHQMIRYSPHAFSVQFHPEFKPEIMKSFIKENEEDLRKQNIDIQEVMTKLEPTLQAQQILRNAAKQYVDQASQ